MASDITALTMVEAYYCCTFQFIGFLILNILNKLLSFELSIVAPPKFKGPLTEELTFRGCSAALLRHCYGDTIAIFVGPLFFSLCHYHHLLEDVRDGDTWLNAIAQRSKQKA